MSAVRALICLLLFGAFYLLQWLARVLLLVCNLSAICGNPVQFPNSQSSGEVRSLRGEPEAEPRVIHRQIKRLLLTCLLGRRKRSTGEPQPQGRFFFPVIQSTNVHVGGGGGGGRPTYVPGGGSYGSSCNIPGSLGSFPNAPSIPALPSIPSLPSLPSLPNVPPTSGGDDGDDDDDDDDDTDNSSNVIPVTETNNEKKRRRRPTTYNINRYLRPFYSQVRRFSALLR